MLQARSGLVSPRNRARGGLGSDAADYQLYLDLANTVDAVGV